MRSGLSVFLVFGVFCSKAFSNDIYAPDETVQLWEFLYPYQKVQHCNYYKTQLNKFETLDSKCRSMLLRELDERQIPVDSNGGGASTHKLLEIIAARDIEEFRIPVVAVQPIKEYDLNSFLLEPNKRTISDKFNLQLKRSQLQNITPLDMSRLEQMTGPELTELLERNPLVFSPRPVTR